MASPWAGCGSLQQHGVRPAARAVLRLRSVRQEVACGDQAEVRAGAGRARRASPFVMIDNLLKGRQSTKVQREQQQQHCNYCYKKKQKKHRLNREEPPEAGPRNREPPATRPCCGAPTEPGPHAGEPPETGPHGREPPETGPPVGEPPETGPQSGEPPPRGPP